MNKGFLIEYLKTSEIFKHISNLLKNFCQLNLRLLDPECTVVPIADNTVNENFLSSDFIGRNRFQNISCPICQLISENSSSFTNELSAFSNSQSSNLFTCVCGFRKVLIPISMDKHLIGYLFTGETINLRLSGLQLQSIVNLLNDVVTYLIKNELRHLTQFKGNTLTHQQKLLNKVISYVKENYHLTDLSLDDISRHIGVSYHYLSRLFKKELNTTFGQFKNKIRLDVASKLLKDKSLTVSEISFSCGYEDPAYFSKVFKENFGRSPVDYRNKASCLEKETNGVNQGNKLEHSRPRPQKFSSPLRTGNK